jgi:hypothetical protein
VHGSVTPAHPGTTVRLERRRRNGWLLVASEELDAKSHFDSMHLGSCNQRYRVRWLQQAPDNVAGKMRLPE